MDQPPSSAGRRSSKRKGRQEFAEEIADHPTADDKVSLLERQKSHQDLLSEVMSQVNILNSSLSSSHSDRLAAKRAAHVLSELATNESIVNSIVECGAIPALLKHLKATEPGVPKPYENEVECGRVLAILTSKPQHRKLIVDAGALPHLIDLLKRHKTCVNSPALADLLLSAADAIRDLTMNNNSIKTRVRIEGGIPPLVELLEFDNANVQSAVAAALRSLTLKNKENQNQVVRCNALSILVPMLGSEHSAIHCHAVGVIMNIVHSSPNITRKVLLAGALQPIIELLRSCCSETQREAAFLIGLIAETDSDCKIHIAQRGAIPPLIDMLKSPDVRDREMSAFALSILAQDPHNQVGIAYNGGIEPLLNNLPCSKDGTLQENVTIALDYLADNEDSVVHIVKAGGVQKLHDGDFIVQPVKDWVGNIMKKLEEKMHGRVLKQLLYLMRFGEKAVQRQVALALAHLCAHDDRKFIFVDNKGIEFLLELLESTNLKQKREASMALHSLAVRTTSVSPFVATPPALPPQVYLSEQYVNNPTFSDITFLVEGKRFYAHRICLLASSDVFRAMFDGFYQEKEGKNIHIPNIKWDVFELMMRFIYTGTVDISSDIAQELLRVADQYLLDGLKRSCERVISQDLSVENVSLMYELSEIFNAISLRQACLLFLLEQFDKLSVKPWFLHIIHQRLVLKVKRLCNNSSEFLSSLDKWKVRGVQHKEGDA